MTDPQDVIPHAEQAIQQADATLSDANRLLSVRDAVKWLECRGLVVHENTMRYWVKQSYLASVKHRIRIADLRAIVACPCPLCRSRKQIYANTNRL